MASPSAVICRWGRLFFVFSPKGSSGERRMEVSSGETQEKTKKD
jgi:hypothetical protein